LLAYKVRQQYPNADGFKVPGGTPLIVLVVLFGVITATCHLLAMADILPVFK
jgi:tryptophan-specific transport protein